jgi:hypothetical protein
MPSRPDLRELASNVKEAFADLDRETLLEILTFVVKEYVVEGPPPMLVHQAETLADLKNATFAQVISALQTRFDFPELQMFVVDGDQVSVRVGGVVQPLVAGRVAPAAESPRPAAGVRVVEAAVGQQRPTPPAQLVDTRQPAAPPQQQQGAQVSAPPPSRGVSVRGRPSGEQAPPAQGQAAQPAAGGAQPPAAQPGAPQPAQDQGDKPDTAGGDDASARFSLLELD